MTSSAGENNLAVKSSSSFFLYLGLYGEGRDVPLFLEMT